MEANLLNYISNLQLGEVQSFENMAVIPIFAAENRDVEYISLRKALEQGSFVISEVTESGSVPNLKVTNHSDQLVLILDGEEIVGARQNRTLNTSVLIDKNKEMVIPVSCTEHGRWHYTSSKFSLSDVIMSQKARSSKSFSVHASLLRGAGYKSDQGKVWSEIDELQQKTGSHSPTSAMKDVFTAKSVELDQYLQAFESMPNQEGCLVFVNGEFMGLDVISKGDIYKQVHSQLIKSFAMEAMLERRESIENVTKEMGQKFVDDIKDSKEHQFDGVGLGKDYRYELDNIFGSALIFNDRVIHLAFFKK